MPEVSRMPERGKALRELRKATGVTMFDVAERLEMQESGLSLIEQERKPMPEGFAARYCRVLRQITSERAERVAAVYAAEYRSEAEWGAGASRGGRE